MAATWDTQGFTIHLHSSASLAGCRVEVTISQGPRKLVFANEDFISFELTETGADVKFMLTQEQSGAFQWNRPVRVQPSVVDLNGYRASAKVKSTHLDEQLNRQVITND